MGAYFLSVTIIHSWFSRLGLGSGHKYMVDIQVVDIQVGDIQVGDIQVGDIRVKEWHSVQASLNSVCLLLEYGGWSESISSPVTYKNAEVTFKGDILPRHPSIVHVYCWNMEDGVEV